jgi:hypothetical protein
MASNFSVTWHFYKTMYRCQKGVPRLLAPRSHHKIKCHNWSPLFTYVMIDSGTLWQQHRNITFCYVTFGKETRTRILLLRNFIENGLQSKKHNGPI